MKTPFIYMAPTILIALVLVLQFGGYGISTNVLSVLLYLSIMRNHLLQEKCLDYDPLKESLAKAIEDLSKAVKEKKTVESRYYALYRLIIDTYNEKILAEEIAEEEELFAAADILRQERKIGKKDSDNPAQFQSSERPVINDASHRADADNVLSAIDRKKDVTKSPPKKDETIQH